MANRHDGMKKPKKDDAEMLGIDIKELTTDFDAAMTEILWEADKHCLTKKTVTRHTVSRIMSEIALEQNLPWHFEQGVSYHCFSFGDVDSLTYLRVIVKQQHIKYAILSTWCIAMEDIHEIADWLEKKYLDRIDIFVGEIFKSTYLWVWNALVEMCKKYNCRLSIFRNHSKVMVIFGENFDAVIESSANVNTNPRSEQTCITVDRDLALWYKSIFDKVVSFNRDFDDVQPMEL